MAKVERDINIRSEEIQDLMVKKPAWMVRWGITTIFLLLLLLLFFTWVMKYPDVIYGRVVLTAEKPPVKVVTRMNGKVERLFVQDGAPISAGKIIAEIENPTSLEVIHYLESYIEKLDGELQSSAIKLSPPDLGKLQYGELQARMSELHNDMVLINLRRENDLELMAIQKLVERIGYHRELIRIGEDLLNVEALELKNAEQRYESDQLLYNDSVISRYDFIQSETSFHRNQQQYSQMQLGIVQNKLQLNTMEMELESLRYGRNQIENTELERILSHREFIVNFINTWRQNFALVAPVDGWVTYLKPLFEGQFINAGESFIAVVQENDGIIGWIDVQSIGFGKVEMGQMVNVRLDNFPFNEFGMLKGEVINIGRVPNQNQYMVGISFPDGLMTSYHQELRFSPEMVGSAEIITRDRRLLQRIFDSIVQLINRDHPSTTPI